MKESQHFNCFNRLPVALKNVREGGGERHPLPPVQLGTDLKGTLLTVLEKKVNNHPTDQQNHKPINPTWYVAFPGWSHSRSIHGT